MKKLLSLAVQRDMLIVLSIAIVGFVSFSYFVAEAVTPKTVGSLYVYFGPNGSEFVEMEYSGFGSANLDGWSLESSSGVVMDLSGLLLPGGQNVRVCEKDSSDSKCSAYWNSNDAFDNAGDSLMVRDKYGSQSVYIEYTTSEEGDVFEGSGDYITDVFGKQDKIPLCHADNKEGFRLHNASVNSLVQSIEKNNNHTGHPDDVIPSFMYDVGGSFDFFPGLNWDDEGKDALAAGCN